MNAGKTVFAQFLGFVPFHHFEHLVDKCGSNRWVHSFSAWGHFICMAYAQLTRIRGLRDLVACLNSQHTKLYHAGLHQRVSRSRPWLKQMNCVMPDCLKRWINA